MCREKLYEKPEVQAVTGLAEGVFMASGTQANDEERRCRFGRSDYNPGRDDCQCCSATEGQYSDESQVPFGSEYFQPDKKGNMREFFEKDFKGCPDNMPMK